MPIYFAESHADRLLSAVSKIIKSSDQKLVGLFKFQNSINC